MHTKLLCLVLCLLVAMTTFAAPPDFIVPTSGRGCIYILGRCSQECEVGTHAYAVGCAEVLSERTCENPIQKSIGVICDYSRCECDPPTLKDPSGNCVLPEQCPAKSDDTQKTDGEDILKEI